MRNGVYINFGIPTFKWSNEAKGKAAVHCVIIGFSYQQTEPNICPYLIEAPTAFIENRPKPICDVPYMLFGSMPRDGGGFILNNGEKSELLTREPLAAKWVRPYIGADEFINNRSRWCLWLVLANPVEIRQCPMVMQRIEIVRNFRASSVAAATRKFAETPTLFCQIAQPETDYIIIPSVSSEKRRYIPIGFMDKATIASNLVLIIPNAALYHFAILTSNVHMAWVRAVCGRLEMRYRYSKDIVYNNFPWPDAADEQKAEIERLAQGILDARAQFPGSSLADLYDPLTMPPELLKAHQANDRAVMKLYGFGIKETTEAACVAKLMELYQCMIAKESE
jgi:hypothetical protein